jgi:hypothetical protein
MNNGVKKFGGRGRMFGYLVLAAIAIGGGYYAWSWNYFYLNAPERVGRDMTFIWQWKMYAGGMKVAYAKDTYGGATPEETLQFFVDALKKGDIELAAKYYIPEKQEEVYEALVASKTNGNLDLIIQQYSSTTHGKYIDENKTYSISVTENNRLMFYIRLILNPLSKKWKISEP